MTLFALAIAASAIALGGALAAARLAHSRSAAHRHALLSAGIYAALTVAPLTAVMPAWTIGVPALASAAPWAERGPVSRPTDPRRTDPRAASLGTATVKTTETETETLRPSATLDAVPHAALLDVRWWVPLALGSVGALLSLAIGLRRLAVVSRTAAPVTTGVWRHLADDIAGDYGIAHVAILVGPDTATPATWGVRRPRIVIPPGALAWDAARIAMVLRHELAHVRRGDWATQLAADVLRAVFWFNPLAWLASARVRRESEHACDDVVLASGVFATDYAAQLVDIARSCRPGQRPALAAVPITGPVSLEGRIAIMLNQHLDRRPAAKHRVLVVASAFIAVALAVTSLRVSAQPRPVVLTGTVYDASGGVLPGVALTLENAQGTRTDTVTDSAGRFQIDQVHAGEYVVNASLPGFKTLRYDVVLQVPADWDRAITLQVDSLQETITVSQPRKSPPSTTPVAPEPVRVGGNIKVPMKVRDVKPQYPAAMQDAGLEGLVPIEAVIGTDGHVVAVRVASAQVHPDFAVAAIDAVRQWRFTPTLLNGTAVEVVMTVTVRFSLTN